LVTVIPFFVFNYLLYRPETANWFHAAFRPLIFASYAIRGYTWLYNAGFWFYFKGLFLNNFLFVFVLPGLYFFFKKKFYKKYYLLFVVLLFFFGYFSYIGHKELRYVLIFLPYLAVFAGFGIAELIGLLYKKKKYKKYFWLFCMFLVVSSIFMIGIDFSSFLWRGHDKPVIVAENYEFLKNNPVVGTVLTTDPLIGVYIDNKIYPAYYSMQVFEWALKEIDYSAIYFTPRAFPCQETDAACQERKKRIIENILTDNNLIFNKNYEGADYYIFSNAEYYTNLPKDELYVKYGLTQSIRLSRFPGDKFPVVLLLEDFPSLDDDLNDIWQKEQYMYVKNFFESKGITPSIAVIPTHLEKLDEEEIEYLKGFEVIQNGYSHEDELSLSFAKQKELIKNGRELIKDLLGQDVNAFIPPFYSSNKDTIKALEELGFTIYISSIGDENKVPMARYDHSLTLINNWNERLFKTKDELTHEVRHVKNFNDYLLVSIYYYMLDEDSYHVLDDFYELVKEDLLINMRDLHEWQQFFPSVELIVDENEITLTGESNTLSNKLTLLFLASGDYSLESEYEEISIKSISDTLIEVCINNVCYGLEPEEIVLVSLI
ncbi:DUF2334 domain-containing protein, partial [Candidatus Woesearchaeota archaeon]|nr:DUF2334 domain-containing protein [Candidatus Woesearchaeota archaeon]